MVLVTMALSYLIHTRDILSNTLYTGTSMIIAATYK
jgi:hypothetical protein